MVSDSAKLMFLSAFSFSTGWVDAIALLKYGCFANMMVGNMIYLGRVIGALGSSESALNAEREISPQFFVGLIVMYTLGVIIYTLTKKWYALTARFWAPVVFFMLLGEAYVDKYILPGNRWNLLLVVWVFGVEDTLCLKGAMGMLPWGSTGKVVTVGVSISNVILGTADHAEKWKGLTAFCMIVSMATGASFALLYFRWHGSADWGNAIIAPYLAALLLLHDHWLAAPAVGLEEKLVSK